MIAVSCIYHFARGFTISGVDENIVPPDWRLSKILPQPNLLMWYGLAPDERRVMWKNHERELLSQRRHYTAQHTVEAHATIESVVARLVEERGIIYVRDILQVT